MHALHGNTNITILHLTDALYYSDYPQPHFFEFEPPYDHTLEQMTSMKEKNESTRHLDSSTSTKLVLG